MPEKNFYLFRFSSREEFELASVNLMISSHDSGLDLIEFPQNNPRIRIFTTSLSDKAKLEEWLSNNFNEMRTYYLIINQEKDVDDLIISFEEEKNLLKRRNPFLLKYPLLQVALDVLSVQDAMRISSMVPPSDRVLIEAGTPLIKSEGIKVIQSIKIARPRSFTVADLKTLDTGALEVKMAADAGAEIVSVSGLANVSTLNEAITTANKLGVLIYVDMMNVENPISLFSKLVKPPDVVLLHRGIDMEFSGEEHRWEVIKEIKKNYKDTKVAVAGGINLQTAKSALNIGADIIIVGRAITASPDIEKSVNDLLKVIKAV